MIDGIGRSTLHSGTKLKTHTDMKTFMFVSAKNEEVIAIVEDTIEDAIKILNTCMERTNTITDDFIIANSVALVKGAIGCVTTTKF